MMYLGSVLDDQRKDTSANHSLMVMMGVPLRAAIARARGGK